MTFLIFLLSMLPLALLAYCLGCLRGYDAAMADAATEDKFPEPPEEDDFPMPIDVDRVDPVGNDDGGLSVGYRDNAAPVNPKQWN